MTRSVVSSSTSKPVRFLRYSIDTPLSDEELLKKLQEEQIKITSLSQYYHNQENSKEHVLIMNYSGVDAEKMAEVMNRFGKVL